MGLIDDTLARLGVELPPAPRPVAAYVPFVRTGNLVVISGQLPSQAGKVVVSGIVGPGQGALSIDDGVKAARLCIINALAVLKDACGGNLDRVVRIVRIGVFVASADGFTDQPRVANGASEFLVALFGEKGKHARAAVGVNTLPLGAAVEIELLAEVS